jgi:hypothetical protein
MSYVFVYGFGWFLSVFWLLVVVFCRSLGCPAYWVYTRIHARIRAGM